MKLFFVLILGLPLFGAAQDFKLPPRDNPTAIKTYYDRLMNKKSWYSHCRDSCIRRSNSLDSILRRDKFVDKLSTAKIQWLMNEFNSCVDCRYRYSDSLEIISQKKDSLHDYLK